MKVKRYKRVQRVLGFYQANFNLRAPYRAILDGTFCKAALENQINLREQIPKYLCDKVELQTTPCVLSELSLLGPAVYGALAVARGLGLHDCGHGSAKSAQACLLNLARRAATEGRVFLGTQDGALSAKLRGVPGTPLLYIRSRTLLIEKPAELSRSAAEAKVEQRMAGDDHQASVLKALKRSILGIEEEDEQAPPKKKKRRQKGVNPLACLKKKKKTMPAGTKCRTPNKSPANTESPEPAKKKRRRKKSKGAGGNIAS